MQSWGKNDGCTKCPRVHVSRGESTEVTNGEKHGDRYCCHKPCAVVGNEENLVNRPPEESCACCHGAIDYVVLERWVGTIFVE